MVINNPMTHQRDYDKEDNNEILGIFSIEDFNTAMKSQTPLKYFRRYIYNQNEHYRESIIFKLNEQSSGSTQVWSHPDLRLGEVYF